MEDTDIISQNLFIYPDTSVQFFAIFDGHGGSQCSEYLRDNFVKILKKLWLNDP